MLVYKATNKLNKMSYIGKTVYDIEVRFGRHLQKARLGIGEYFHRAIKKYGPENFAIQTLIVVDNEDELNKYEIQFIKEFNTKAPNGYNLTDGGEGTSGYKHTNVSKQRMREGKLGKRHPPAFSHTMSLVTSGPNNPNYGKIGPSNPLFGRKRPPEVIEKIRLSHIGKKHSEETKDLLKGIQKQRWAEGVYAKRNA